MTTPSRQDAKPAKPFGWEVTVEFSKSMVYTSGWRENWKKTLNYKGSSEQTARRRAMLKPHARAVLSTRPYATEADYIRAV